MERFPWPPSSIGFGGKRLPRRITKRYIEPLWRSCISIPERDHRDARSEGWLDAEVWVKLGAWSSRYSAQFHEDDFSPFAEKLGELHTTLKGDATLSSLDGYLDLTLTGDGLGHISVVGELWDQPRVASHLVVSYNTDQTVLPALRTALASLAAYLDRTR